MSFAAPLPAGHRTIAASSATSSMRSALIDTPETWRLHVEMMRAGDSATSARLVGASAVMSARN